MARPKAPYLCSPVTAPQIGVFAPGATSGLSCSGPFGDAGASLVHSVSLYQFGDQSSLDNALNSALHKTYIKGSKPQPCPGLSSVPQAWHHAATPDKTEGQIGCLWANDAIETPYLYWTSNAQLVFGELEDVTNLDMLYQWWRANYGT